LNRHFAAGASRLKVLRYAVLPQVMPQCIAYTLYILDRNIRMATVIGLVGAGGIGQELKGRCDMYNYGYVGTILVAIFVLVVMLNQNSARLRPRDRAVDIFTYSPWYNRLRNEPDQQFTIAARSLIRE
jgi:ABC-type phosphate/phosphonate transport system permease subunit